jgi:hypothetical protein
MPGTRRPAPTRRVAALSIVAILFQAILVGWQDPAEVSARHNLPPRAIFAGLTQPF